MFLCFSVSFSTLLKFFISSYKVNFFSNSISVNSIDGLEFNILYSYLACAHFRLVKRTQLEELGFMHEITLDGVVFSRSEPDAGEHDPGTKIAAAPFLGLGGSVDLGSLDQVVGAAAYKGFNRCPVLVCPNAKVDGVKSTYYKFCANPSKFHNKQ